MRQVCGLDVHKDSVFMCIVNEEGVILQEKFGVLTSELKKLSETLQLYSVEEVCMESTSIYWMPVWRLLERDGFKLKLVNPYFIKQLPGKKSDIKDAEWIATCLLKDLVKGSYVPDDKIQQLRQYDRRILDLDKEINSKLAKLDAALQRCNIRISNYVSKTSGKSYREIVKLISCGVTDSKELCHTLHGRVINHWGEKTLTDALTGVFTDADIDMISQLHEEIQLAEKHKEHCQQKMEDFCEKNYKKQYERLQTIPGIKKRSATSIIAEVGTDMSSFEDAAHLVSWAGLRPRNDESAGKIKYNKTTHGNKYLRNTLIECSWGASRTKDCFFNKFYYTQTAIRHKNKMKVTVAIARKLLTVVWFVLEKGVVYQERTPDIKQEP